MIEPTPRFPGKLQPISKAKPIKRLVLPCLPLVLLMVSCVQAPATGDGQGAQSPSTYWGCLVEGASYGTTGKPPWDMSALNTFESHAGKASSIFQWGMAWYGPAGYENFDPTLLTAIRARGTIPMVDWRSWDYSVLSKSVQPAFKLSTIIDGTHDAYVTQWAQDAKAWGHPFFLRFDPEMNGDWYAWSETANGNAAGEFVRAWRHVRGIFNTVGATNVTWVWAPNAVDPAPGGGSTPIPLASVYPGDAWVDWAAMDGYNWSAVHGDPWKDFATIFGSTYAMILGIAPGKPMMIAETASSETGAPTGESKATWIAESFGPKLARDFPGIKAILWFNINDDGADWIVETSAAATLAFKAAIADDAYAANDFAGLTGSSIAPLTVP